MHAPTLRCREGPQSNATEPCAPQEQSAAPPTHSSPPSKEILHRTQSVQPTIPAARAERDLGNLLEAASHQKTGGQGGEQGSARVALPWSWRHLPNRCHGSTASAREALDRFLARWKMGGSQRQCKESRTKLSQARLKAKRALPATKAGEAHLIETKTKQKKSSLV